MRKWNRKDVGVTKALVSGQPCISLGSSSIGEGSGLRKEKNFQENQSRQTPPAVGKNRRGERLRIEVVLKKISKKKKAKTEGAGRLVQENSHPASAKEGSTGNIGGAVYLWLAKGLKGVKGKRDNYG